MASKNFDWEKLETVMKESDLGFERRETEATANEDDVRERIVYAAPLNDGFHIVLQLRILPDSVNAELHRDQDVTVFLAHEQDPDQYLEEVTSMPLISEWEQYIDNQIEKAFDRIRDPEHCEECNLPMVKYSDYAGEFYACVSFDCENVVEVEPMDHQLEKE